MDPGHQQKYNLIKLHLEQLLAEVSEFNEVELNHPTAEGKWSVAQIIAHIHLSFRGTSSYLSKKLQYPETIGQNLPVARFRSFLLNTILKSRIKFRAVRGLDKVPDHLSHAEMKELIQNCLLPLEDVLLNFPANLNNKNVFRHPIAGRITMGQTLSFLDEHLQRHRRQINRYLKSLAH